MFIKQHIPNFVEGVEPQVLPFETLEELLAIEFVHQWAKDPGFFRFSISDYYLKSHTKLLMAERNQGKEWWVVGYLPEYDEKLGLPQWELVR